MELRLLPSRPGPSAGNRPEAGEKSRDPPTIDVAVI
jgi:hypothetical protein